MHTNERVEIRRTTATANMLPWRARLHFFVVTAAAFTAGGCPQSTDAQSGSTTEWLESIRTFVEEFAREVLAAYLF